MGHTDTQLVIMLTYTLTKVKCQSWNSNTLATSCEELTHLKRPWCWERLKAGREGDDSGWDGLDGITDSMDVSLSESGSWWWTGRAWRAAVHGVTKCRTQLSDWTELSSQYFLAKMPLGPCHLTAKNPSMAPHKTFWIKYHFSAQISNLSSFWVLTTSQASA